MTDDVAVLAAAHAAADRLVRAARAYHGSIPPVGSPEWFDAPCVVQAATLVILGEAYFIADPKRAAIQQLKAISVAISEGLDWSAASRRPSHAELVVRRAELGPTVLIDREAAACWAAPGSAQGGPAA
jgi:hypothetical protein